MAGGDGSTKLKWWHGTMQVLDRSNALRAQMSSISDLNAAINANPRITARIDGDCTQVNIPVKAFSSDAPGRFLFRPSLSDLGGSSGGVFIPSDYNSIVSIENRFIFDYRLNIAFDDTDTDCNTAGPPNDVDPQSRFSAREDTRSLILLFPPIPLISTLGCCNIAVANPGAPLSAGQVLECSRIWFLSSSLTAPHLYSFDFQEPPGEQLIDRGEVASSGLGTLSFYDLAWDDRNYLWGLEENGLRQIIPGDSNSVAAAMSYSVITDSFNGSALSALFPIDASLLGTMKYNQNNSHLYIIANATLFELAKTTASTWNITRYVSLGSNIIVKALSFDIFGRCYCIFNNDLALLDFDDSFGTISRITTNQSMSNISTLDFVPDLSMTGTVTLYGTDSVTDPNGHTQIYTIDPGSGSQTYIGDLRDLPNILAMTSCQAGEDASGPAFPFETGDSPWIFMVDGSGSMLGNNRWDTLVAGMQSFLDEKVNLGDKMVIVLYNQSDNPTVSPFYEFVTSGDIDAAKSWIESQVPTGQTNFCIHGPFNTTFLSQYTGIKNIIVIGDGGFTDCPADATQKADYFSSIITAARANGNPDLTVRAVGIFPDTSGRQDLTILGNAGGGGYTEWV